LIHSIDIADLFAAVASFWHVGENSPSGSSKRRIAILRRARGAAGLAGGSRHFVSTMIFTYSDITISEWHGGAGSARGIVVGNPEAIRSICLHLRFSQSTDCVYL
jgi:hypothetical protein